MSTWLAGKSQKLALFLVISSLVGALGWLYRSAKSSKTNFLPTISGAEWIIYPKAPEGRIHPHLELATVFRRSFVLNEVPAQTELRTCAFHRYSLLLNGRELEKPPHDSWKNPDRFSISDGLHPGTNEILVTVFNTNGPPALWLSLKAGKPRMPAQRGKTHSSRKCRSASRPETVCTEVKNQDRLFKNAGPRCFC
jgi:hypothetical protein